MKARVGGHFGEWVQGRLGPSGPIALATVPCPVLFIEAERTGGDRFALAQYADILDRDVARAFLATIGGSVASYRLTGNILPGGGAGASTAALIALARAAGGDGAKLVEACVTAEGASDPLMLAVPDSVIWASRDGRSLGSIPPLPPAEIVGGFWGPPVATDATDYRFPHVSDLTETLQKPLSLKALAEVASTSARRCTELRGPWGDPTPKLARTLGALGHLRAHTGSARGLIFRPGTVPKRAEPTLAEAGFTRVLRFETGSRG